MRSAGNAALALARRIDYEYAEEAEKRKTERMFPMPDFRPGDPASTYYAHMENIRRHLTIEDYSRVDAMIALRLRSSGHSRESVEETIRACAPTIRGRRAATGSVMPSVQRITPLARPVTGIWKEMSGIGCGGRKLRVEYISRSGLWLESLLCRRQSFLDKNNKFVIMVNGKGNFDV